MTPAKLTAPQEKVLSALNAGATIKPRFRSLNPKLYGYDAEGGLIQHCTGFFVTLPNGSGFRINENIDLRPVWAAFNPGRIFWTVAQQKGQSPDMRQFGPYVAPNWETFIARFAEFKAKHGGTLTVKGRVAADNSEFAFSSPRLP